MSNSTSFSTFKSSSYSSSSSTVNGETHSHSRFMTTDPQGTRVHERTQEPGRAARDEQVVYDAQGRKVDNGGQNRIQDVTDEEKGNEYETKMEDEYAKREGGA